MELRVLKYFLTIAEEGSITKAANTLHVTQPTLSRQLRDLEDELGALLIVRGKQEIALTAEGKLLVERAGEILALCDKTIKDISQVKSAYSTLTIGCVESMATHSFLPQIIDNLLAAHADIRYDIYNSNSDDIVDKVAKGLLDIGIVAEPIDVGAFNSLRLPYKNQWQCLMRMDDPLAKQGFVSLAQLAQLPLILPRRKIVQEEICSWFSDQGTSLKIIATTTASTNVAFFLVQKGLGYAITTVIKDHHLIEDMDLTLIPLKPEKTFGNILIWKKNRVFTQSASRFIEKANELTQAFKKNQK